MEGFNPIALIVQPSALSPQAFVGVASGLCALTGCIIGLRLVANYNHLRTLHSDDYLSLLALLFLIWNSVTFSLLMHALNSNPDDVSIERLTRLVALGIASGNGAIYSAKLPLLFMLKRTFGVKIWFRWTCIFLIVFGTLGGVVTLLYASITCSPDLHTPTPPFLFACVTAVTNATIARGSLSLAVDIVIFILPISIIVNLKMPARRKIGLAIVFATGLLAIAASALGLYFQIAQSEESSTNFANALLVTVIESAIVTMVSCTPGIHLFWTKHAGFLRRRLGIGTQAVSQNKSTLSESNTKATESKDRILVSTHHYIELEEGQGRVPYDGNRPSWNRQ